MSVTGSPSTARRTPFAMRDETRRTQVSWRSARTPETTSACSSAASTRGRSAGSFCRSASSVTITRAAGARQPGGQRGALAGVLLEQDRAHQRVPRGFGLDALRGAVRAAVVHQHDFVRARDRRERGAQLGEQRLEILDLVVGRDHDRDVDGSSLGVAHEPASMAEPGHSMPAAARGASARFRAAPRCATRCLVPASTLRAEDRARARPRRRRIVPLEQLALELGSHRPRWTYSRPLLNSPHRAKILERLEFVRRFFPELDDCTIRVGLARKRGVLGWGSLDPEQPGIWVRPRRIDSFTVAHEFTHLLQARGLVPRGERSCDLWALARSPLLVDQPPSYLRLPRTCGTSRPRPNRRSCCARWRARRSRRARRGDRATSRSSRREVARRFPAHANAPLEATR